MENKKDKKNGFFSAVAKGVIAKSKTIFQNPFASVNMNPISIKYYKHLPANRLHIHHLLGKKTWFYGGGEYLHALKEVFLEKAYLQKLPENAYILDCGAHIGISVIYLKHICPSAKIVSFEPDARNFELLKKNIASHQLTDVEVRQEAIWIDNTNIEFIEEGNMGSKIAVSGKKITNQVAAVRLKDFLNRRIDFLKIDIEGAEYAVLKDIRDDLDKVDKLFVEYHGTFKQNAELNEILEIVTGAGFVYYIKEASEIFRSPFSEKQKDSPYDLQLNIFCLRT